MAISVVKKNVEGKVPTWRGFIADTIADLALLPISPAVAMGSECYCSEDGNTYILETDGDWVVKKGSSGGGSSEILPEVTTEDNGQVLTVVDGEWNKSEISSALVVHFDWDEATEQYTTDKNFLEIQEALSHGQQVIGESIISGAEGNYYFLSYLNEGSASFYNVSFYDTEGYVDCFNISYNTETEEEEITHHGYTWVIQEDT